jgi:hypothetical protein
LPTARSTWRDTAPGRSCSRSTRSRSTPEQPGSRGETSVVSPRAPFRDKGGPCRHHRFHPRPRHRAGPAPWKNGIPADDGDRVEGAHLPSTGQIGREAVVRARFGGYPRCSPPYCWYDDLSFT